MDSMKHFILLLGCLIWVSLNLFCIPISSSVTQKCFMETFNQYTHKLRRNSFSAVFSAINFPLDVHLKKMNYYLLSYRCLKKILIIGTLFKLPELHNPLSMKAGEFLVRINLRQPFVTKHRFIPAENQL